VNWTGVTLREWRESQPPDREKVGRGKWIDCLSREGLGRRLRVHKRTIARWENDEQPIPAPVKVLLSLMAEK